IQNASGNTTLIPTSGQFFQIVAVVQANNSSSTPALSGVYFRYESFNFSGDATTPLIATPSPVLWVTWSLRARLPKETSLTVQASTGTTQWKLLFSSQGNTSDSPAFQVFSGNWTPPNWASGFRLSMMMSGPGNTTPLLDYIHFSIITNFAPSPAVCVSPRNNSWVNASEFELIAALPSPRDRDNDTPAYNFTIYSTVSNNTVLRAPPTGTAGDEIRCIVSGLADGRYRWNISAWDGLNLTPSENVLYFNKDTAPPPAPTPLPLQQYSTTPNITFRWNSVSDPALSDGTTGSGISFYEIEVFELAGFDFVNLTYTGKTSLGIRNTTSLSWTFSAAQNGKAYAFRVRAADTAGNKGEWSYPDSSTEPFPSVIYVDTGAPEAEAPYAEGVASNHSLVWRWNASIDNESGIQGYLVTVSTASSDVLIDIFCTDTFFYFTSPSDGVGYYITIRAVDLAGNAGPRSSPSPMLFVDSSAPSRPGIKDMATFFNTMPLSVQVIPSTDPESGIAGYQYRVREIISGDNGGFWERTVINWTPLGNTSSFFSSRVFNLTGFEPVEGASYIVDIVAINGGGTSSAVNSTDGAVYDTKAPPLPVPIPQGNFSTSTNITFYLVNVADSLSGLKGFEVKVGRYPDCSDATEVVFVPAAYGSYLGINATPYTISGVSNGQRVYIMGRTVDNAGNRGEWSPIGTSISNTTAILLYQELDSLNGTVLEKQLIIQGEAFALQGSVELVAFRIGHLENITVFNEFTALEELLRDGASDTFASGCWTKAEGVKPFSFTIEPSWFNADKKPPKNNLTVEILAKSGNASKGVAFYILLTQESNSNVSASGTPYLSADTLSARSCCFNHNTLCF
ncbi:MAG: hypothetical protein QW728_05080, partial [Thermoplasmata archaeon]